MKKQLAYASNCSDSLYSYIYRTLQKRAGDENEAFISRPFPAAVQLNKKRNWPGIMPVHGSCFSTRGVTIASLTQRCWLFYSSSAYLISSAKK